MRGRAAIALAVFALIGLGYGVRGWETRAVAFDRALWAKEPDLEDTGNWRNRMADDVLHRLIRPGMTKAEVLSQLGGPDPEYEANDEDLEAQFGAPVPPGTVSALCYVTYYGAYAENGDAIYVFLDGKGRVVRAAKGGMWT